MRGPALAACGYQAISAVALGPEPRLKHLPRLRCESLNLRHAPESGDPAAFTAAPAYTFGNAPRTIGCLSPGYENWDISVFKSFPVRERITFQFRAEALNAFNTPQFRAPNTAVGNSNFGAITQQANFPRYLQLGGRISF